MGRVPGRSLVAAAAVAMAMLPINPVASGESRRGGFAADLEKMNRIWPGESRLERLEDALRLRVRWQGQGWMLDTHLFGQSTVLIPYHDEDGIIDAAEEPVERGDSVLARYFPPGSLGYAVRHRRPQHRTLDLDTPSPEWFEELKLRDSHLEMLVGVVRDGQPGVVTINSPQAYELGRFGGAKYPMILLRPVLPASVPEAEGTALLANIRTMMVGLNSVSRFALSYDRGDDLTGFDRSSVIEAATNMVRAIAGEVDSRRWFERKENRVYCSELALLAASSGLLLPLNGATFVPLVGEEIWQRFEAAVAQHNAGQTTPFTSMNENPLVRHIELSLAPTTLQPLVSYLDPSDPRRLESLAFRPMTAADLVERFVAVTVPRQIPDAGVRGQQVALIKGLVPRLLMFTGLYRAPEDHPRRVVIEELLADVIDVLSESHPNLAAFRTELDPLLFRGRCLTGPRGWSGQGLVAPPHLFHLVASGQWNGGLLDLEYVGHGFHYSLVRAAAAGG